MCLSEKRKIKDISVGAGVKISRETYRERKIVH